MKTAAVTRLRPDSPHALHPTSPYRTLPHSVASVATFTACPLAHHPSAYGCCLPHPLHASLCPTQTATIYKQGNALLPKHYTFKVQSIKPSTPSSTSSTSTGDSSTESLPADSASLTSGLSSSRKTIGRARLDLAQFCSAESTPSSVTEVCVPLEPQGTLTLSIKTIWLQHYDHARSAQLLQQGDEGSSTSQAWCSSSDTNTDKSSVRSSMHGSAMFDADRDTCESHGVRRVTLAVGLQSAVQSLSVPLTLRLLLGFASQCTVLQQAAHALYCA
jgi:hypothetical protein